MNPRSSAMDWFVLCSVTSVHDTRNIFLYIYIYIGFIFKCIYAFCHVLIQGPHFASVSCARWKYECSYYS